jgi:hypothetical protein
MLHIDMPKTCVVEKKFLLGSRKVFIYIGHDFHIEDLREVSRGAGGAGAFRPTRRQIMPYTSDEVWDGVFCGNGNIEDAVLAFGVRNIKPHVFVVASVARVGARPAMESSIGLGGHKTLFGGRNIVSWHAEDARMIVRINDGPFNYTESLDGDGSLDSLEVPKIARNGGLYKVGFLMRDSNGASGVKTDGKEVGSISNVMACEDSDIPRSACLETTG